ncbi:cytochrome d ubiquinol oxidase subunit II [Halobacterium hubeiense]|uniref:cytochrome d ubiquinol oxidase subunit II n=1 Tax=Halobacterium hubeiense TaxID=1407499 RepID=UPI00117B604D|nr:cytochrome d ubiquinol oxidase subunit II [Halobacterium hubeiense]
MSKTSKIVLSQALLVSSYLAVIHRRGIRATTDEALVIGDIRQLLESGHLANLEYFSGAGYHSISGTLLSVTGQGPESLQYLSPVLAVFAFASFFACGAIIVRQYDVPEGYTIVAFALAIFVFAGFVSRIVESTHKKYTFVLVFSSILLAHQILKSHHDRRRYALLPLFLVGIGVYNYVWGAVYTATIGMGFIASKQYNTTGFAMAVVTGLFSVSLPRITPVLQYHGQYISLYKRLIDRLFSEESNTQAPSSTETPSTTTVESPTTPTSSQPVNDTPTTSTPDGAGERRVTENLPVYNVTPAGGTVDVVLAKINQWPAVSMFGFSISIWFAYVVGILTLGMLAGFATLGSMWLIWKHEDVAIAPQYLGIIAVTGGFFALFVVTNDVATLKRIIVLPGVFSVLVLPVVAARSGRISSKHVAVFLVVVTLLGAVLAIPRTLPDGGSAPIDNYGGEQSLAGVAWLEENGANNGCYAVSDDPLGTIFDKRSTSRVSSFNKGYANLVYASGTDGEIFYNCI